MTPSAKFGAHPGAVANEYVIRITLVADHTVEVSGLVEQAIHAVDQFQWQTAIDNWIKYN